MIIYFSGTGNSKYVAKSLAQEGEEVVNIFDYKQEEITANRVGIVFPVYCYCLPHYLAEFLQKTKINAEYIFSVATCGGSEGKCRNNIQYILQQNNAFLSHASSIIMPDSCVFLHDPSTKERLLAAEDTLIGKIKKDTDDRKIMDIEAIKPYNVTTKLTWFVFRKIIGSDYKKANSNCNGCLSCVNNCPTGNIKMENGNIRFGNHCVDCFRCINICPTQAIKFGFIKATKQKQYTHI